MLLYEKQILREIFEESCLIILARGLGLERLFAAELKIYAVSSRLTLVINTTPKDQEYFISNFVHSDVRPLPQILNTDISIAARQNLYDKGGVQFVTSRILIGDLLSDRVPVDNLDAVLVYRAHELAESFMDTFILRLVRIKNRIAAVKAFSDQPASFARGLCDLQRLMDSIFAQKLFAWPRFHASVLTELEKSKLSVTEVVVKLSPIMRKIQTSLLELIATCLREIKQDNREIEAEQLTVDNALGTWFNFVVQRYLEPVWHTLTEKTRNMVSDLKSLSILLRYLELYDPICFLEKLDSFRTAAYSRLESLPPARWLETEAAQKMFVGAKERAGRSSNAVYELPPKWDALHSVLAEIRSMLDELKKSTLEEASDAFIISGKILLLASDEQLCEQLTALLRYGPAGTLETKAKPKVDTDKMKSWVDLIALIDLLVAENLENSPSGYDRLLILLVPYAEHHTVLRAMYEWKPTFLICYNADLWCLRQIEVYQAANADLPCRVYFMMYQNSTEEQRYLSSLRRENEAFEYLIRQKGIIPSSRSLDVIRDPAPQVQDDISSRKGDRATLFDQLKTPPRVIVDLREFRSELPSLVHKRGIDLLPLTLEVADYVLTPDTCVERKSVSDLIGSLNGGRLFTQASAMTQNYARSLLLIEFDGNRPFSFEGQRQYMVSESSTAQDPRAKLVLLTILFPQLKLIWSMGPAASAEIFEDLKWNKSEPDVEEAAKMQSKFHRDSTAHDADASAGGNLAADLLLKLPGISLKQADTVAQKGLSLHDLCHMSDSGLSDIFLDAAKAANFKKFLEHDFKAAAKSNVSDDKKRKKR